MFDTVFRKTLADILRFFNKLNTNVCHTEFDCNCDSTLFESIDSNYKILENIKRLKKLLILPLVNDCDAYMIVKNARLNQYNCLLKYVLNKESRDEKLFIKWKNVTSIKACNRCGRKDLTLKKCQLCEKKNQVYYCSKKCQKKDWNGSRHCHQIKVTVK